MRETLNRDQGIEVIRNIVAESLAREAGEVRPESRLVGDLGADSLDFIDMVFTLEKRFGLKMREQELDLMGRREASDQGDGSMEFLPPRAVARLLTWLPELTANREPSRIRPVDVLPLITVESLWRLVVVQMKIGQTPGSGSA